MITFLLLYTVAASFFLGRALVEIAKSQRFEAALDLILCFWLMFLVACA